MKATLLLADVGTSDASGKLNVLGAGWQVTAGPPVPPQALAVLLEVPWSRVGQQVPIVLTLTDADGQPVLVGGADGQPVPLTLQQAVEASAVPGLPEGAPVLVRVLLNLQGLPLEGNQSYRWELQVDGETREDWSAGFHVVALADQGGAPQPPAGGAPGAPLGGSGGGPGGGASGGRPPQPGGGGPTSIIPPRL